MKLWVKRNPLKWFGHVERMVSEEFVKVHKCELKDPNRRGRPLGRWKDKVEEYLGERKLGEVLMKGDCLNKQGETVEIGMDGNFCHGHSLRGHS